MTEDEAKTKWCPLTFCAPFPPPNSVGTGGGSSWTLPTATRRSQCIASACMAWRKSGQIGVGPSGEKRDRDLDGRTRWLDVGFCGAFGEPKQ